MGRFIFLKLSFQAGFDFTVSFVVNFSLYFSYGLVISCNSIFIFCPEYPEICFHFTFGDLHIPVCFDYRNFSLFHLVRWLFTT